MRRNASAFFAAVLALPLLSMNAAAQHAGGGHGGGGHGIGGGLGHGGGGFGHGSLGHGGIFFGGGFGPYLYDPYWPYAYRYAYPPTVVVNRVSPLLTEDLIPAAPPPPPNWYHCNDPEGYYPYVRACNNDWQPVPATPPG